MRRESQREAEGEGEARVPALVVLVTCTDARVYPRYTRDTPEMRPGWVTTGLALVTWEPRPSGEEPSPHGRLDLEERLEESAQVLDLLLAEELAAEDLEIALPPERRRPQRRVRARRRLIRREIRRIQCR